MDEKQACLFLKEQVEILVTFIQKVKEKNILDVHKYVNRPHPSYLTSASIPILKLFFDYWAASKNRSYAWFQDFC